MNAQKTPQAPSRIIFTLSVCMGALFALLAWILSKLPTILSLGISPLIIGMIIGLLVGPQTRRIQNEGWHQGTNFCARRLLRVSVGLYGLNISLQDIAAIGVPGVLVSIIIVASVMTIGYIVGKKLLKLDTPTVLLTSAGSAICGAAAVLALESSLKAKAHQSSVAIATVVFFGTLSLIFYPIAYKLGWLPLSSSELGMYIGATVHEVAQVVATASNIDAATTDNATIIKMTRVALLIPTILLIALIFKPETDDTSKQSKLPVPWFVIGFVLLASVNSIITIPDDIKTTIRLINTFLLTMAMTAIGLQTQLASIKAAGPRVFGLAAILYVWLVFGGYFLTRWLV